MTEKYFINCSPYNTVVSASILRYDGKKIVDITKNNEFKYNDCIPENWINIPKDEALYLVKKEIDKRIFYHETNHFYYLSQLGINDKCFYLDDKRKQLCTILHKTHKIDGIFYVVSTEKALNLTVPIHQIEFVDENEIRNRTDESTNNLKTNMDKIEAEDNSESNNKGSNIPVCGIESSPGSIHINEQHDIPASSNVCHTTKESRSKENDRYNMNKSVANSHRNDSYVNSDQELSRQSADNHSFIHQEPHHSLNKGDNAIPINSYKSSYKGDRNNECLQCPSAGLLLNPGYDNVTTKNKEFSKQGAANNLYQKQDYCPKDDYKRVLNTQSNTYKDNEVSKCGFVDKMSHITNQSNYDQYDEKKTVWYYELKLNGIYLNSIQSIITHQQLRKFLIYKYKGRVYSIKTKWLGLVDDILSIGVELYFDSKYGTNGIFKNKKCFECADKRGLLIHADGFCIADNSHKQLMTNDSMSIIECSVCCIETSKQFKPMPLRQDIIVKICKTRKFVKCLWFGRINDVRAIGMEVNSSLKHGIDGFFSGVRLFNCFKSKGFLCRAEDVMHVPKLEFIRNMYLMQDYDLSSVRIENNIDIVGRLMKVLDDPIIYGRARFGMTFFKVLFMVIEIDEHNLENNISLTEALYYNTIIPCKYAVVVKIDKIETFEEPLKYVRNSAIVDPSSIKVVETYKSEQFKLGDTVCYNEFVGNIIAFQLLNDIPCVCVRDIYETVLIREDALSKLSVNELFGTVTDLSQNKPNAANISPNHCEFFGVIQENEGATSSQNLACDNEIIREDRNIRNEHSQQSNIQHVTQKYDFYKAIFLNGDPKLFANEVIKDIKNNEKYAHLLDSLCVYGYFLSKFVLVDEHLIAIEIDNRCLSRNKNELPDKILYDNNLGLPCVVIVREQYAFLSDEPFKCTEVCLINDQEHGIARLGNETCLLNIDDIVKYEDGNIIRFKKIVMFEEINNIHNVGLIDTLCRNDGNDVTFMEPSKLIRVTVDNNLTKYFEDVIIDPRSIVVFTETGDNYLNVGDAVQFELKVSKKILAGKINVIAEINNCSAVVVELNVLPKEVNLQQYIINEIKYFKDTLKLSNASVVVRRSLVYKQNVSHCLYDNITILDPITVDNVSESLCIDKTIVFENHRQKIVTSLKWIGYVNSKMCIGCEMRKTCKDGTNGMFANNKLFDCKNSRGVVIPLDTIEECCVGGSHKQLQRFTDGRIKLNSVCCFDTSAKQLTLKLGERVMKNGTNEHVFGTCRWIGLVNNIEVIGVEMNGCCKVEKDALFNDLAFFECASDKVSLFHLEDFISDSNGQCYCTKNNITCIDIKDNIVSVDNAELSKKTIAYKNNKKSVFMDILWKGIVNGVKCVACELKLQCKCGMDGKFGGDRWFECKLKKGYIVPLKYLPSSCEYIGSHCEPNIYAHGSINPDSICCVENVWRIERWPLLRVGSKLKYRQGFINEKKIGNCKWMGFVNGIECIGANLKDEIKHSVKGVFSLEKLFKSKRGQNAIFPSDDVEHDIEGEKLHFVMGKVVDIKKLWKVKRVDNNCINGIKMGSYVSTFVKSGNEQKVLMGELKWIGIINGKDCVGIDLESACNYGMNGVIDDKHIFECRPQHGIVTTVDNVKLNEGPLVPTFIQEGLIDADKYMIIRETHCQEYLREKNIDKNGPVTILIRLGNVDSKRKGVLKWCGTMNNVPVAVVELDQDFDHGTNGQFWRHQLINCKDKRAVAVQWDKILQYIQYQSIEIPEEKRVIKEISINSAVVHYRPQNDVLTSCYGTVKWSGVDSEGQYLYGIDLDDRYCNGTNGCFMGQQLFQCNQYYGIIVPISEVAPDIRFVQNDAFNANEDKCLKAKTKYFDSSIIDPRSVVTLEMIEYEDWINDTIVEFKRNECDKKYYGLLKWSGLINKIRCAVIDLNNVAPGDPISDYLCSGNIIERMKLPMMDTLAIVLFACINKSTNESLRLIFDYFNDKDVGIDILMVIINNGDTGVLKTIVKEWNHPIYLESYPEVLPKLIDQSNYDLVSILLNNFVACSNDTIYLLCVAKYFLLKEDFKTFLMASNKCTDVNIFLLNGETFVTDVIKSSNNENIIREVIESKIFDINMASRMGDIPLLLSCKSLMVSTVKLLLSSGANVGERIKLGIDSINNMRKNMTDTVEMNKAFEIMEILTKEITYQTIECKICMDKSVDTAFDCGHTVCNACSKEMTFCPDCRKGITERRRIYLP